MIRPRELREPPDDAAREWQEFAAALARLIMTGATAAEAMQGIVQASIAFAEVINRIGYPPHLAQLDAYNAAGAPYGWSDAAVARWLAEQPPAPGLQ